MTEWIIGVMPFAAAALVWTMRRVIRSVIDESTASQFHDLEELITSGFAEIKSDQSDVKERVARLEGQRW